MGLRGYLLTLVFAVTASSVAAQSGPGFRFDRGIVRPFAEPLYWLNLGPEVRLPIRERVLETRIGFAGLALPPDTRQGFTPFAGLSFTGQNTTDPNGVSGGFTALGLGLSYSYLGRRDRLQANYYGEVRAGAGSSGGIETHGGTLSYTYDLSQINRFSALANFSSTSDLQSAPLPGAVSTANRITTGGFTLTYGRDRTRLSGYEFGLSAQFSSADQGVLSSANTYDATGRVWHVITPKTRIETNFRLSELDIAGRRYSVQGVDVGYTMDLGPRLATSGYFGLLNTDALGGKTYARYGGSVVATHINSRFEVSAERELSAVLGLGGPALTDRLTAQWQYRIDNGWLSSVTLEGRRLEDLSAGGSTTTGFSLEGQMSYAINKKLWAWGRLSLTSDKSGGTNTEETRISVGVSRNLR